MAIDGRKLRDTLRLGSEDLIEFPCSPCEKDGKNVASIKHCIDCGENLCKTCLSYHEKFTRGHQIVDKLSAPKEQKRPKVPIQRCTKHGEKLVDVFCPTHDTVGCATCVAFDHSSCKGIQYIPDVVKASPTNKDITDLETRMKQLLTRLDKMKNEKQDCLKQLRKEKDDILKEIRNLRKKLNDHLDKMEKKLENDVESRLIGKIQSVNQCLEAVNNMTSSIEKRRKTLQEAKNTNDAEIFVQMKQGNEHLRELDQNLKQLSSEYEMRSIKLFPGEGVLSDVKSNTFGHISEILIPKSIEHIGDFNVRLLSDKNKCNIGDLCFTTSGFIVCIDWDNGNLKKLDSSYSVIEHLDMRGDTDSLCEVDSTQLAVTMVDRVQFVSQKPLRLGTSFHVGDHCRGITCLHGQLYVCCGGWREKGEGPGHLDVYDLNGKLLKIFYDGLSLPCYIKSVGDGKLILSDGLVSKLHNVNKINFRLSEIQIKTLRDVSRFCGIGDGQLCIGGYKSNNIVLISDDGEQQQQLLAKHDGIAKPWAVCFDEKQSRLNVSLHKSDVIQVFRIVT